jgi:hypothetical protein
MEAKAINAQGKTNLPSRRSASLSTPEDETFQAGLSNMLFAPLIFRMDVFTIYYCSEETACLGYQFSSY